MLCRATKWKSRHKYHSNTELHNIQQYSFPPNQMKRQLNMNNMFSKCPRLHIRAHREIKRQKISFKALSVTTWRVLFQKAVFIMGKRKIFISCPPCKLKCGRASLERCSVECTMFKKIIFNAFNHLQNVASLFYFTCTWMEILFWTDTLVEVQQTVVRDPSPLCGGNRCGESERGEEEILKALEHHQTGKTPTHNRAKKDLRSSQASLNGSLSANCTTQPWVGERALLLSDLFISLQLIRPLSAVISTLCVTSPRPLSSPQKPSCHVKHIEKETLHMESKRRTYNSLDGRILVFGCKCSSSTWGS